MSLQLIKALIFLTFVPPIVLGVGLLVFGAMYLDYMDKKEGKHGESECDGGR